MDQEELKVTEMILANRISVYIMQNRHRALEIHENRAYSPQLYNLLSLNMLPDGSKPERLYFKAAWKHPFKKSMTCEKDFYLLNGETVKVPFMTSTYTYYYQSFDGFMALKLPYQSVGDDDDAEAKKLSMLIFLPDDHHVNGLEKILAKFCSDPSSFVRKTCEELEPRLLSTVCIPKFEVSLDLRIFKSGVDYPSIKKFYMEVSEEGTELGLEARAGSLACEGKSPRRVNVLVDHSFFLVIMDERTGHIFLNGIVYNPLNRSLTE